MTESLSTFPLAAPLAIVFLINLVVFVLTYWLVYRFKSTAKITMGKWAAGGALAGFIIITSLEIKLVDHFTPASDAARPSYKAVYAFYDNLNRKQFHEAWQLIYPDFQKSKWQGDFNRFSGGYRQTVNLSLLAIKPTGENSSASQEYVVYYLDEADSPVIPGLEGLSSMHVKDLDRLQRTVRDTRALLSAKQLDVDTFDDLSLYELMAPDRGSKIVWLLDAEPKLGGTKAEDLFKKKSRVVSIQAKLVTTLNTKDGWRINSICPAETSICAPGF